MSKVSLNIAANVAGQATGIVLSLICTPFYIKLLGIEAYGLFAFYLIVQAALQIFDLGFAATVNREIARLSTAPPGDGQFAAFVATFERWYWFFAIGIGAVLFLSLPALTEWWLHPNALAARDIASSARVFALVAMLQWVSGFYVAGLMGLQRQVALNLIQVPFSVMAAIGGLIFIWLGPRSITALLGWQAAMLLCQAIAVVRYFWSNIGFARRDGRVQLAMLQRRWRFAFGMAGISTTGILITYVDKWILSRLLSLETFAHYSLAVSLSRALYVVITPVFNTYFPRFSSLIAMADDQSLRACYHTATQVMAVLVLPMAAVMALFSEQIALLWLHDAKLAADVAPLASILIIGTCLNGLMNIPFAIQLAHGNTRIGLATNLALLVFLLPAVAWATIHYGALGGAATWAIANAAYALIGMPITHARIVHGDLWRVVVHDLLPPTGVSIAIVFLVHSFVSADRTFLSVLVMLGFTWLVASGISVLVAPHVRARILSYFGRARAAHPTR